jgi:hypothetical protein
MTPCSAVRLWDVHTVQCGQSLVEGAVKWGQELGLGVGGCKGIEPLRQSWGLYRALLSLLPVEP